MKVGVTLEPCNGIGNFRNRDLFRVAQSLRFRHIDSTIDYRGREGYSIIYDSTASMIIGFDIQSY